jgi:DeoR/GlpR family transcriptional regulator of sugar metabolism
MQIFLSHSSKQKPLVRELIGHFPDYLCPWIDEKKLLFGDSIPQSLETTIKSDADYVLFFIDEFSVTSSWVSKELEWALEAEKINGRTILLPIVVEENAFQKISNVAIRNRKYLGLKNYTEASVRALSEEIISELFGLICRELDRLRKPNLRAASVAISYADELIHAKAALIQKAVFPHRKSNPISLQTLREVVNSQSVDQLNTDEFKSILETVIHQNLIPGLDYDGFELYLIEEHSLWKAEVHHDRKVRVGRKVSGLINNDSKVFLDAGSTNAELASILCKRIENHLLTKITLATTSIYIANMILHCCVSMGFDDVFTAVRLFVPGGLVRPGTQAIIATEVDDRQILQLADHVGGFDIGVIGVNGVDADQGFTTHEKSEVMNKVAIMKASRTRLIVGDSSKIGIALEGKFADFSDDLLFVVDQDANNEPLCNLLKLYKDKIILA